MIFKETEREKIAKELVNRLIPNDVLEGYYYFGFAEALLHLRKTVDGRKEYEDVIKLIDSIGESDEVKLYYNRLKK